METDFFSQGFSEKPLVCWFASEVPKMETLEVGFLNSFTPEIRRSCRIVLLAHTLGITTQGTPEPSGPGPRETWLGCGLDSLGFFSAGM